MSNFVSKSFFAVFWRITLVTLCRHRVECLVYEKERFAVQRCMPTIINCILYCDIVKIMTSDIVSADRLHSDGERFAV